MRINFRNGFLSNRNYIYKSLLILFCLVVVGLSMLGGFLSYSPVPYWDMWDGIVQFILNVNNGSVSDWFALHNEHRIFLSRILFWIDYKWFNGVNLFLILINYILVVISCGFFIKGLDDALDFTKKNLAKFFLAVFSVAWLFSWSQNENFTVGFQVQFFLAQLLPLVAFYYLIHSLLRKSNLYFFIACLLGILSCGTMANGVLVLPLMFLYLIISRQKTSQSLMVLFLSLICLYLYFYNFPSESSLHVIKKHPLRLVDYVINYFGNPFYFLFRGSLVAKLIAQVAGCFILISTIHFSIKCFIKRELTATKPAFLLFIIFIVATATITGIGRLKLGQTQVFTSRYLTPALMAWAALIILYAELLVLKFNQRNILLVALFANIVLLLLGEQLGVFAQNKVFERRLAALALSLQIDDPHVIQAVYPDSIRPLLLSEKIAPKHLFVFGQVPFSLINPQLIDKTLLKTSDPACEGQIDTITSFDKSSRFVRIEGWLKSLPKHNTPEFIRLFNQNQKIIGYAVSGAVKNSDQYNSILKSDLSGYKGYILVSHVGKKIYFKGENPGCLISMPVPRLAVVKKIN